MAPLTPDQKKKFEQDVIRQGSAALGQLKAKEYVSPTQQDETARYKTPQWVRALSAVRIVAEAIETAMYIHHGLTSHDNLVNFGKALQYADLVSKTLPSNQGVNIVLQKQKAGTEFTETKFVGLEGSKQLNINAPDSEFTTIQLMGSQPITPANTNVSAKTWEEQAEFQRKIFDCAKGIEDAVCGKYPELVDAYGKVIDGVKILKDIQQPEKPVEDTTILKEGEQYQQVEEKGKRFSDSEDYDWWKNPPPTGNAATPVTKPSSPDDHSNITPTPQVGPSPGEQPNNNKPDTPNANNGSTPSAEPKPEPGPAPEPPAGDNQISDDNTVHFASVEALDTGASGPEAYAANNAKINAVYNNILNHTRELLRKAIVDQQANSNTQVMPEYHVNIDKLRTIPERTKDDAYKADLHSLRKAFFALLDASDELRQIYKRVVATDYDLDNIEGIMQVYGYYKSKDKPLQTGDIVFFANPDENHGGCWAVLISVKDREISEALMCHNPNEGYSIINTYLDKYADMGEVVKAWSPAPYKIFSDQPQLNEFWGPNLLRYRGLLDNGYLNARDFYTELFKDTKYNIGSYSDLASVFKDEIKPLSDDAPIFPGYIVFNDADGAAVVLRNAQLKGRINESNDNTYVNTFEWKTFGAKSVWIPHL